MQHGEKIAPVAAALTGLATLACCLPMGFAAAVVTASLSTVVAAFQPWFLGASVGLLLLGVVSGLIAGRLQPRRDSGPAHFPAVTNLRDVTFIEALKDPAGLTLRTGSHTLGSCGAW